MNKKLNVKGFCTDLAYDLVGSVLYAAGIVCFVNPANMAPGGMSGVAILLNYLWGLPIGTMTIVLNIPLLILSYIFLGKSLTWKTSEITGDQQFNGGFGHGQICTDLCR